MRPARSLEAELLKAKEFQNTHAENFPGFKDIINPAYQSFKANEESFAFIELVGQYFTRQSAKKLGLLGIAESEMYGADFETASRMNAPLSNKQGYSLTQHYVPKGKKISHQSFEYHGNIGTMSQPISLHPTIIQRLEAVENKNWKEITIIHHPNKVWNKIELLLKTGSTTPGPTSSASLTFEQNATTLKTLPIIYAHAQNNMSRLQSFDFPKLMMEIVGDSSWFSLHHAKENESYTFLIDPNGIAGNITKTTKEPAVSLERDISGHKSTETKETISGRYRNIEEMFKGFEPAKQKTAALEYYLKNFPPQIKG